MKLFTQFSMNFHRSLLRRTINGPRFEDYKIFPRIWKYMNLNALLPSHVSLQDVGHNSPFQFHWTANQGIFWTDAVTLAWFHVFIEVSIKLLYSPAYQIRFGILIFECHPCRWKTMRKNIKIIVIFVTQLFTKFTCRIFIFVK